MKTGTAVAYRVFVRNWWKRASGSGWPNGLEPDPCARKTTIATNCTEDEAYAICKEYAASHKPGPLSRKAEYERM